MMVNNSINKFKKMAFPLNVYAYSLWLEEGQAEYLHYGLFENSNESVISAQQRSTDLILKELPPPPASILEVGSGLGTTLKILVKKGYSVKSLTPDEAQITYIKNQWKSEGLEAPVLCQKFEDFTTSNLYFDVVLLQESAQYINALDLLNKTLDILKDGGDLIIVDEFSVSISETECYPLHFMNDFLSLANRQGFTLKTYLDLSSKASRTLDYLLHVINKHRSQLISDLSLTPHQLDQLKISNHRYQSYYKMGVYGYALLHFKKKDPTWRISHFKTCDFPEFQELFKTTFNNAMSFNLWKWKYASQDATQLCIRNNGKLIGHYGAMPRDVLLFGKKQRAIQIGDVIVSPNQRGALRKKGPFFFLAATFIEQYIGYGKPFLLAFGFPNLRTMKVAEYLGLYSSIGKMVRLSWPPLKSGPCFFTTLSFVSYDSLQKFQSVIEYLWSEMALDLKNHIIGIRNYDYIKERYANHPENSYQFILIKNRFLNRYYGFVVIKIHSKSYEIMDVISSLKNISLVIFYVRRYANQSNYKNVICYISERFSSYFITQDVISEYSDIHIANNIWSPGPSISDIKGHWWLMNGDTDCQ